MPKVKQPTGAARRPVRSRTKTKLPQTKTKAKVETPAAPDLKDPALFLNRELSLLAFQRRVLEEAEDPHNPLLERVKFLSIVGSNLDEFYMVRVAGLLEQIDAGIVDVGPDGLTPQAQMAAIRRDVKRLFLDAHVCLRTLGPELENHGIRLLEYAELNPTQTVAAKRYFDQTIFPVLTPLAFDPGRPFPHISNLSLNLAVVIRDGKGVEHFARVKVPDSLPQLVPVTVIGAGRVKYRRAPKRVELVWIENVVSANLSALFPGMEVVEAHPFHVTRDGDIAIRSWRRRTCSRRSKKVSGSAASEASCACW